MVTPSNPSIHHPPFLCAFAHHQPPPLPSSLPTTHHTQRRKGEWGWTCWCCGCVMDGVGGMCGLWVVLCVGCVLHGLLIPSLCPHQTTTTLPFSSPFTTPLFCLCVWKRGRTTKWMVWNGVWCVACNTSATVLSSSHHQPLCVSRPSPFPSHSQTPSLLPCLFWFVWTERVKDKCGTHHVKHTVHHIQSTPHSFHPITPPFQ